MPGFLGGSSGAASSGAGGEITFPKEFIDPVTKLRVSQPENLIDTDFEYGLQPTKWETVELINNTPSFFSKSGDTTIPGIVDITTNAGTREITVTTALDHGLAVGIPINVQGTKSVTADGSYIINSIPDTKTFTYLSRDIQDDTSAIEDLYTSIITGEFFQGSQLRVAESDGIVTDAASISTLTVTTENPHGFGPNTPFYFLNLNSTISQEFEAANTAAKSFDASNSATAQTFDGSNSLSSLNIDWSNSATVGGTISTIDDVNTTNNTITVAHSTENFSGLPLGQPLYYSVNASLGYFLDNPRGVVFLKSTNNLGEGISTFQVSEIPDGDAINLQSNMTGSFQIANQARTFAGNNVNSATQTVLNVVRDAPFAFEGANDQAEGGNGISTITSFNSPFINVSTAAGAGLDYYIGAMVRYDTTGSAASGLQQGETYFISSFQDLGNDNYTIALKDLPNDANLLAVSGGTGTQTLTRIGVSTTKDIIHIKNSFFTQKDMLEYEFPANGNFTADEELRFYFVQEAYDQHNYKLNSVSEAFIEASGGDVTETVVYQERNYTVHRFTQADTVQSLDFFNAGTFDQQIKVSITDGAFGAASGSFVETSLTPVVNLPTRRAGALVSNGNSVGLDGVTHRVNWDAQENLNTATHDDYSVEAWFSCDDVSPSEVQVIYEEGGGVNGINMYVYNGRLYGLMWTGSTIRKQVSAPINSATVYHAVFVGNVATPRCELYLNGSNVSSVAVNEAEPLTPHGDSNCIGSVQNDTFVHFLFDGVVNQIDSTLASFAGKIGDVARYDYDLTAQQVSDHYAAGLSTNYVTEITNDAPLAWFRLDEAEGIAINQTGASNGTYLGGYKVTVNGSGVVNVGYPQDDGTNDIPFSSLGPAPIEATGGTITDETIDGVEYRTHTFSGNTGTLSVTSLGNFSDGSFEYIVELDGTNPPTGSFGVSWSGEGPQLETYDGLLIRLVGPETGFEYLSPNSASTNGWVGGQVANAKSSSNGSGAITFAQALEHTYNLGGRLPTLEEILNEGAQGSGSGYDNQIVWTCTHAGDPNFHYVVEGRSGFNRLGGIQLRANTDTAYVRNIADVDLNRPDPVILIDSVIQAFLEGKGQTITNVAPPTLQVGDFTIEKTTNTNLTNIGPLSPDEHGVRGAGRIKIRYRIEPENPAAPGGGGS